MSGAEVALLVSAICFVESGHNPTAIHIDDGGSPSIGYCQVKQKTCEWIGVHGDLFDPAVNQKCATKYLRKQLKRYQGNPAFAVSAYNCGHVCNNPTYVNKVFSHYERLKHERKYPESN